MQVDEIKLKRQQEVLKALGFYAGTVDGLWGPASITAKKEFEKLATFKPGVPSNGLPFADRGPYPVGISLDDEGLLTHPLLISATQAVIEEVVPAKKKASKAATAPNTFELDNSDPAHFVPKEEGT